MSERQIDEAIDEAVRDLMNVDADAAFRARVVERLRKPTSHAPFWRQLSIVSGAVGIAVIAVALTRSAEKPAVEARSGGGHVRRSAPACGRTPRRRAFGAGRDAPARAVERAASR